MQDDRTPHLALPLPHVDNDLSIDVGRLRNALTMLDAFAQTGTIAAAQKLATARKINGVDFDGTQDITITAAANGGSAATAAKLATARKINGVDFDGTADITITASANGGSADYAYTAEQSVTATRLAAPVTINGVNFDGSSSIVITASDASRLPLAGGKITGTAESTSPVTGALQIVGGLGVGGNIHLGGALGVGGNVDATGVETSADILAHGNIHADGQISADGDIIGFAASPSDARLKKDVVKISGALEKTLKLQGVHYTDIASSKRRTGVIAQEVQEVLPEAVVQNGEYLAVAYGNISGLLIEAIKELDGKIEALSKKRGGTRRS